MANWLGVITNAGNDLLTEWVNEKKLNFDRAAAGEGTVSSLALLAQTDLVAQRQEVNILGAEKVSSGIRLKLRLPAAETGYSLTQYGVWASVDGGDSVLIALFQHDAGGVPIPCAAESPDFVFTFYALISTSNTGSWSVTVDTSTVATMDELHKYIQDYYANVGSALMRDITIPAADWRSVGSGVVGDYAYVVDVALSDALDEHFPSMSLDVVSLLVATDAGVCPTIQAFDGAVRFWSQKIPVADLTGTIMLRSENLMQTGAGGGDDVATDEEVQDAIDEVFSGETSEDSGDSESGDAESGDSTTEDEIATDDEIDSMLDGIFGE